MRQVVKSDARPKRTTGPEEIHCQILAFIGAVAIRGSGRPWGSCRLELGKGPGARAKPYKSAESIDGYLQRLLRQRETTKYLGNSLLAFPANFVKLCIRAGDYRSFGCGRQLASVKENNRCTPMLLKYRAPTAR